MRQSCGMAPLIVTTWKMNYVMLSSDPFYASDNHVTDFLICVASGKKPIASEIVGGHSAICCHLLKLVYFDGQKIKWEPKKMEFAGGTRQRAMTDARLSRAVGGVTH